MLLIAGWDAVIEAVAPGSGGQKGGKSDADAPIRMPHTRDQGIAWVPIRAAGVNSCCC